MRLRSLLFVPGDRPDRMEKALNLDADALILDLEDAVSRENKAVARAAIGSLLRAPAKQMKVFVRINSLDSGLLDDDLAALRGCRFDGVVLPKAEGAASIEALKRKAGDWPVLPIATETPEAIFQLSTYKDVCHLLLGLTWGAEDLSVALGASTSRHEDGSYTSPYELARSLTLVAGRAADVPVFDTVFPAFRDLEGLANYARRARRDGFDGMMAIHPSQIAVINEAFTPSRDELHKAEEIVNAFAANPNAGVLQIRGHMVDAPHLKQAHRIITMAKNRME